MKANFISQSGFTLIEILIVVLLLVFCNTNKLTI